MTRGVTKPLSPAASHSHDILGEVQRAVRAADAEQAFGRHVDLANPPQVAASMATRPRESSTSAPLNKCCAASRPLSASRRIMRARTKHPITRKTEQSGTASSNRPLVTLSQEELARVEILVLLDKHLITWVEASSLLKVKKSQVYRLLQRYRLAGPSGLISKSRGVQSNRAFPSSVKTLVLALIRENYSDYGPTLIAEILPEKHGIKVSAETVRRWMISAGLWATDRATRRALHQPRRRMTNYGDLVQMDGSDHDWFEGRGPRCTAMVMVDDATGRLQTLRFFPRENRDAYFRTVKCYISEHGRPLRIQTDKHGAIWSKEKRTDFTVALDERLKIIHSIAHSPQSKGRVERMNRTLQDRLVKAFRREGISSIEAANEVVPGFLEAHNSRFGRNPWRSGDSHRPIHPDALESALALRKECRVTKDLTFSFQGHEYLIEGTNKDRSRIAPKVRVELQLDGTMAVFANGRRLTVHRKQQ